VMLVDGAASDAEHRVLHAVLQSQFDLDDAAIAELIEAATAADREAIDLYQFTSLINRSLDEDGRRRIVEMMWQLVYADGHVNEFEDNVIWRAADLLGLSSRERIGLRQRIAAERAAAAPDE
ncbi:MAG: TerB family tellurite resistance protein, partial [Sphingomicrobium sp.]